MPSPASPVAYLDHAASTPMRPEAVAAMVEVLEGVTGNPSGRHRAARGARRRLDDAREAVADALGAEPAQVVFTSGGTEADNLAVASAGGRVLAGAVEHHAVLRPVLDAGGTVVPVDGAGRVDTEALRSLLADAPAGSLGLVSVMVANNEVGTIQPLAEVAEAVAEARGRHRGLRLHTDAVAAAAWLDLAALTAAADLVALSAHKVGGPTGVGALVVRRGPIHALARGGGQEHERRAGTPNLAGAVGFAAALQASRATRTETVARVSEARDRLVAGLVATVDGLTATVGPEVPTVANIAHVCVAGVDREELLFLLDEAGVAASAGSSCASGALEPSHVLAAMGVAPERACGALRLSLGWSTTDAEIERALAAVAEAVARLRGARR